MQKKVKEREAYKQNELDKIRASVRAMKVPERDRAIHESIQIQELDWNNPRFGGNFPSGVTFSVGFPRDKISAVLKDVTDFPDTTNNDIAAFSDSEVIVKISNTKVTFTAAKFVIVTGSFYGKNPEQFKKDVLNKFPIFSLALNFRKLFPHNGIFDDLPSVIHGWRWNGPKSSYNLHLNMNSHLAKFLMSFPGKFSS